MSGRNGGKPCVIVKEPEQGDPSKRRSFPDFAHMDLEEGFDWPAPRERGLSQAEEDET